MNKTNNVPPVYAYYIVLIICTTLFVIFGTGRIFLYSSSTIIVLAIASYATSTMSWIGGVPRSRFIFKAQNATDSNLSVSVFPKHIECDTSHFHHVKIDQGKANNEVIIDCAEHSDRGVGWKLFWLIDMGEKTADYQFTIFENGERKSKINIRDILRNAKVTKIHYNQENGDKMYSEYL